MLGDEREEPLQHGQVVRTAHSDHVANLEVVRTYASFAATRGAHSTRPTGSGCARASDHVANLEGVRIAHSDHVANLSSLSPRWFLCIARQFTTQPPTPHHVRRTVLPRRCGFLTPSCAYARTRQGIGVTY